MRYVVPGTKVGHELAPTKTRYFFWLNDDIPRSCYPLCGSLIKGRKIELAILMGIVSFVACLFSTIGCHFMRVEAFLYGGVSIF
jgi:hypothetical protein